MQRLFWLAIPVCEAGMPLLYLFAFGYMFFMQPGRAV